jgi:hypothetical protein
VQNYTPAEFANEYQAVAAEHGLRATDATAIKFALLLSSRNNSAPDLGGALSLLAAVGENPSAAATDRRFALLMHDLIARIDEQRLALASETTQRQTLERQLDALKQLEERLNADGLPP